MRETVLLRGADVIAEEVRELRKQDNSNLFAVFVQVGENPASTKYVNNKLKLCKEVGIETEHLQLPRDITEERLLEYINMLNSAPSVVGYMVQLPLPKHINESKIIQSIDYKKDIDGFTSIQKGLLMEGVECIEPCTPKGIFTILKHYELDDVKGKKVVIAGRSNIVGKPLANMFINRGATVLSCNSTTDEYLLAHEIAKCDIFISAIGKANYFNYDFFKRNGLEMLMTENYGICKVAIDVGINFDNNNKLCGDIDKDMYKYFNYITPVPGGVGRTTVLEVVKNIRKCADLYGNKEDNNNGF